MKKSMWKKLMSTILALVMVLGLSGTLGFQHVDATENSGFTFLPDKTEVKRGDIVTYSIDLAKNAKIAGITAQFTFDPDVLEAVGDGVDAKGYVKNAVKKGNVSEGTFGDFYVNTDGRIGIVAILNDNDKDKLADGNVAKISFKVKDTAKGDIGLKVKNLEFCDVNSEDIPTSEISVTKDNDAQIKVVVLATGITVDKTATTIVKGATDKLTATLVPADANGTITWSTSDSSVATVSSDGTVTAVKNGTATVTAKCGDLSAQTKVTVINPLKAITITGTTHSIKKGQTTQLGLTYDPADTTDSVAATWTSSNTSVAKESVYVTWFSKKFLEDNSLADKINNAKDGENVEDTLSKDGIVSKAALNALKGREVSLVLSIADQNAKWIINGTSVNDVSDDINLSVTRSSIDTGNISYDKISKLLSKRQAEQIAFGNSDKFNFTGKLEVSTSGLGGQDKAVLIQKSDSDNMEYTNSAKINDASTTFTVDNGHDGVIIYGMNGDTNADSKIDIRDAVECLRHVSGREDIDVVKQGFADVNFDDKVNVQDLIKEIHVVSGREDTF